jgi:hypothetical protein
MYSCFGWGKAAANKERPTGKRASKLCDVEAAIADIWRELATNVVTQRQLAEMAGVKVSDIKSVRLVSSLAKEKKNENLKRSRVA